MEGAEVLRLLCVLILIALSCPALSAARILVCQEYETPFGKTLVEELRGRGMTVEQSGFEVLSDALATKPDILALPDSQHFPQPSLAALESFCRSGGHLLVVGGPAFDQLVFQHEGKWATVAEARTASARAGARNLLFDFKKGDEQQWTRSTNHPEFLEKLNVYDGALSSFVEDVNGWNTYDAPPVEKPFGDGHTLTVFEACGDANTTSLFVEWREKDGSRWIVQVPLSERWRAVALAPEQFSFYPDNSPADRGGPSDQFNPANAASLHIGLAENLTTLKRGRHIWWIRRVGTSPDPAREHTAAPPIMETLSPDYKTYPAVGVARISARADQAVVQQGTSISGAFEGRLPVWRPRGTGYFDDAADARFLPVMDAYTARAEWRGTAAWLQINTGGTWAGSSWACIGADPESVGKQAQSTLAVLAGEMVEWLLDGTHVVSGGANGWAFPVNGEMVLGSQVVAAPGQDLQVEYHLASEGKTVLMRQQPLDSQPGKAPPLSAEYEAKPGPARIIIRLLRGAEVIDEIHQPIVIQRPVSEPQYVKAENGQFVLDGKAFYANGVNYWPRSSAGLEPGEYHLGWLLPWQYDPEVVERDLRTLSLLRVNLVSIMYRAPGMAPQLVDFLERCRIHGILVNIYIEGAHPLHYNPERVRELIEAADLPSSPQVFAYDLAWEPHFGNAAVRTRWDGQWAQWIEEQYGSLERAEQDWGHPCPPNDGGQPAGPADDWLVADGPWCRLVAAYRRFTDDLVSREYGKVVRFVRSLDPEHLVGARTGYGGTGQQWPVRVMPFDLAAGAAHLDFISPEAYGVDGDLDQFLAAGFTTEYARFVSGGKPVFWAEYGRSVWPSTDDPEVLETVRQYYRHCYSLFQASHANGSAAWWYPGGYRVDEKSDYGLVRQDAVPRPAADVLREESQKAQGALTLPAVKGFIPVDRDQHVDGYAGVYEEGRQQYLVGSKRGQRLIPRTGGTGTDSSTCPSEAIGGAVWDGTNPPKYLNAEIYDAELSPDEGTGTMLLRLTVLNTGESTWLKGPGYGSVCLSIRGDGEQMQVDLAADVRMHSEAHFRAVEVPVKIIAGEQLELRMLCRERGPFGERIKLNVAGPGEGLQREPENDG